jgi:hypothetical protein
MIAIAAIQILEELIGYIAISKNRYRCPAKNPMKFLAAQQDYFGLALDHPWDQPKLSN